MASEKVVFKAVRDAFEAQEARTMKRLRAASTRKGTAHWDYGDDFDPTKEKKALPPQKVFPLEVEKDAFEAAAFPPIQNIYESFGAGTAAALGVAFNLRDPAVAADILQRSNRIRGTVDTTWHAIQEAIIDGEAAGDTIDGIQKRIGRVFTQAKGYRSRVIARTETVGAMNAGSLQAADQSGVVEKKVWLAAMDHRTRSAHVSADGQAVDTKAKFEVGGSRMDHPGDPAGGASQVVNCRCSMVFRRAAAPAIETTEVEPALGDPEAIPGDKVATMKTAAARLRTQTQRTYPQAGANVKAAKLAANAEREAALRDLGRQVREEALERAGAVALDTEREAALQAQIRALRDARFNTRVTEFGVGTDPATGVEFPHQVKPGKSRLDAYKAYRTNLEKEAKKVKEELNRLRSAPKEARGRAALEVLRELREMGTDPKAIVFDTGSSTAAKASVKEMAEWFPTDWWEASHQAGKIQAQSSGNRGYYGHVYGEKRGGSYRQVSRLMTTERGTGDYRSTTVHELGHRMESTQEDLTNLELRFWRRRTDDGNGFGGMRTYRHGGPGEVVNPDEFGDEYMGKSYMDDRHKTIVKRERGKYDSDSLDDLESNDMAKTTSFETFTMGMEELVFNNFRSWDEDLDLIDFVLGVLAGV